MINTIAVTGGCGYISVSWAVTNNVPDDINDMCGIGHFNATLSSVGVSMTVSTAMISYNFTGLLDDTLFNATVIGTSINEKNIINSAFTSVKTSIIESMCNVVTKCRYTVYVHTHMYTIVLKLSVKVAKSKHTRVCRDLRELLFQNTYIAILLNKQY